jgi:hypothetical protein
LTQDISIPGQNVARAASKIGEVKAAFQRAFTTLTAIPFPIETDNNLGLVVSVPQAVNDFVHAE